MATSDPAVLAALTAHCRSSSQQRLPTASVTTSGAAGGGFSGSFSGGLRFSGSRQLRLQGWLEDRLGLWFAIQACFLIGLRLLWFWLRLLRLWLWCGRIRLQLPAQRLPAGQMYWPN